MIDFAAPIGLCAGAHQHRLHERSQTATRGLSVRCHADGRCGQGHWPLLKRVFDIDVERGPTCGRQLETIAASLKSVVIDLSSLFSVAQAHGLTCPPPDQALDTGHAVRRAIGLSGGGGL